MPRGRGQPRGLGEWAQKLGQQIGAELGQMIAQSVQETLEGTIDARAIARRLGASLGGARRGRATGPRGACNEPGCGNPVLAKGLCRSHYYRARYRAQKAGTLRSRGRKPRLGAPDAGAT
jgi:hypothetical protein